MTKEKDSFPGNFSGQFECRKGSNWERTCVSKMVHRYTCIPGTKYIRALSNLR